MAAFPGKGDASFLSLLDFITERYTWQQGEPLRCVRTPPASNGDADGIAGVWSLRRSSVSAYATLGGERGEQCSQDGDDELHDQCLLILLF